MKMTPYIFSIMRKMAPETSGTKAEFIAWLDAVHASTEWPEDVSEIEFKNAKIYAQKIKQSIQGA